MLPIVFDAIKDTNYEYKTCVTWLKTTKYGKYAYGLGNSFRQCTEQLLIFDRRGVKPIRSSLRSIVVALRCPRTRKPKNFETSLANFMVNSGLSGCYLFSGAPMDEDLLSIIDYVDIV
jgi:N6-adenosine-specific RNA methylase IME4